MQIYLDNAATTPLAPEARAAMLPYLEDIYGNPSSTHATGRKARSGIEQARKQIAALLGVKATEIIFTSGGTEAINLFLQGMAHQVPVIISSPLEHPAVLKTLQYLEQTTGTSVRWLPHNALGQPDLTRLEEWLADQPGTLVALMHANNETGNLLPIEEVGAICQQHNALFFTDAVQTAGHYVLSPQKWHLAGLAASAHKFHGPKGAGFLYLRQDIKLQPLLHGGNQERSLRPGTENPAAIAGMATALQTCHDNMQTDKAHISRLKAHLLNELQKVIPGIKTNGTSSLPEASACHILSVSLPPHPANDMLLFKLDMAGIAVSAGSACASGAQEPSHVMAALKVPEDQAVIRFSFSRYNSLEEIDTVVSKLAALYQ